MTRKHTYGIIAWPHCSVKFPVLKFRLTWNASPSEVYEKPSTQTYVPPGKPEQQVPISTGWDLFGPLGPNICMSTQVSWGAAFPIRELNGEWLCDCVSQPGS